MAAYRAALQERTRERVPLHWAMTQNNSATRSGALGERESGTARLEEAVAAYRAALQEYTRERVPLDWAMTQNNLGNALCRLGERESGTTRLEEAASAYRAALAGIYARAGAILLGDDAKQSWRNADFPGGKGDREPAGRGCAWCVSRAPFSYCGLSRPPANGRWMRLPLVVETGDGVRDGTGESVGISEGTISEIMLLEVTPASLDSLPRT